MLFNYIGSWYKGINSVRQFDKYKEQAKTNNGLWLEGLFEISIEEIAELSNEYDVAIMHFAQQQPTKKELKAGAKPIPDAIALVVDVRGGSFKQR